MKVSKLALLAPLFFLIISSKTIPTDCKNSIYIVDQVINRYDANHQWSKAELKIHIQEPRVGNPKRFTKLSLQNASEYFEMERFREDGTVKRILTGEGDSKIFLNGQSELSDEIKKQYKLNIERSISHKNFYQVMYGLPMSINNTFWDRIEPAQKATFEGKDVYRIKLELKEELISKYWTLLIGVETYKLLAIEFNPPDDSKEEGELLKFVGEFVVDGIKLPQIRNWYVNGSNEYLGSDIIVQRLDE